MTKEQDYIISINTEDVSVDMIYEAEPLTVSEYGDITITFEGEPIEVSTLVTDYMPLVFNSSEEK
jgi:hypothetical protein